MPKSANSSAKPKIQGGPKIAALPGKVAKGVVGVKVQPLRVDVSKIRPEAIARATTKFPVRTFHPVYKPGDKTIRKDDEGKFDDAIRLFGASGKEALSDNRLPLARFGEKVRKKLAESRGKKIARGEPLVELVKAELKLERVVPFVPSGRSRKTSKDS